MVSRFTLDSATEFLFGQDLETLSASLPYPPTSDIARVTSRGPVHPADRFAQGFLVAQEATAERNSRGSMWPLFEFWEDKVKPHMHVVDEFIDPIIGKALEDKKEKTRGLGQDNKVSEDETLLSHLVNLTDGMDCF